MANIDTETNQRNLAWLAAVEKDDLGLSETPEVYWSPDNRRDFLVQFSRDIIRQPNLFSDGVITSAQWVIHSKDVQPDAEALQGYGLAWSHFAPAVDLIDQTNLGQVAGAVGQAAQDLITGAGRIASNLAQGAVNVSQGIKNSSETAGSFWLLPVALIAIVGLLTVSAAKRVKQAASF